MQHFFLILISFVKFKLFLIKKKSFSISRVCNLFALDRISTIILEQELFYNFDRGHFLVIRSIYFINFQVYKRPSKTQHVTGKGPRYG